MFSYQSPKMILVEEKQPSTKGIGPTPTIGMAKLSVSVHPLLFSHAFH